LEYGPAAPLRDGRETNDGAATGNGPDSGGEKRQGEPSFSCTKVGGSGKNRISGGFPDKAALGRKTAAHRQFSGEDKRKGVGNHAVPSERGAR